jgi:putative ABC transport system ATP-binding protein
MPCEALISNSIAGELVVLLGASGSGKSTLVNILGGLDTATDGKVFYREKDLTQASDRELTQYRRNHVGFVFQFYNLIPSLTAKENVAIVTEIAKDPMTPEQALEIVGLGNRKRSFSRTTVRRGAAACCYCKGYCQEAGCAFM